MKEVGQTIVGRSVQASIGSSPLEYSSYITAGSRHCHLPSADSSIVER